MSCKIDYLSKVKFTHFFHYMTTIDHNSGVKYGCKMVEGYIIIAQRK